MCAEQQVNSSTPLWTASCLILSEKVETFFRYKKKVLKGFSPEDIHDLRVSSRRLREAFALFAPCYVDIDVKRCIKKVKKVTRALGKIRNDDEVRLFLLQLFQEIDGACQGETLELVDLYETRREKLFKKLKGTVRESLPKGCLKEFLRVVNSSLMSSPAGSVDLFASVSEFGKTAFEQHLGLIHDLVPHSLQRENYQSQHLLRIAVKHFRYRMECIPFLIEPAFSDIYPVVKEYQEVLGKLHDMGVFAQMLREADVSEGTRNNLLKLIREREDRFFNAYCTLMETNSLISVGERVKAIL